MKTLLNVRVDQELKDEIDRLAKEDGISSSECARNILSDYLDYDDQSKSIWKIGKSIGTAIIYVDPPVKEELAQLALFLFVNLYSKDYYTLQNLRKAKRQLENLTKNELLSIDLRNEFLKVLNDINRVLIEGFENTQLYFTMPNNIYTLNFNLLFVEAYNWINRND